MEKNILFHKGLKIGGQLDESTIIAPRAPTAPKSSRAYKRTGILIF
jgi:hypothetical protein